MRKLSPLHQRQLACFGALLAPIGAVCAVSAFDRLTPRSSVAAPAVVAPAALPGAASGVVTEAQKRALEWLASRPTSFPEIESPLESRKVEPAQPEPGELDPASVHADEPPAFETPVFRLTLLMVSWNESLASIDGALYQEGDEVRDGWRVAWINGAARTVMLRHTTGATVELHCDDWQPAGGQNDNAPRH